MVKNMTANQNFNLCRLCLCKGHGLMDIFEESGTEDFAVDEAIQDLLTFRAVKDSNFPWLICSTCIGKLSDFRLFKRQSLECKIAFEIRYFGKELSAICTEKEVYIPKKPDIQFKTLKDVQIQTESHERYKLEYSGDKLSPFRFPFTIKKEAEGDYEDKPSDSTTASGDCTRAKVPKLDDAESVVSMCEPPIKMEEVDLNEEEMKSAEGRGEDVHDQLVQSDHAKKQEAVSSMEISDGKGNESKTSDILRQCSKSDSVNAGSILKERLTKKCSTNTIADKVCSSKKSPKGEGVLSKGDPKLPSSERSRHRVRRRSWVHPSLVKRANEGTFGILHEKLRAKGPKFFEFYRMSTAAFDDLLAAVRCRLQGENAVMCKVISAEEKLSITLRYLGSGCSFRSMSMEYLLGRLTITAIVRETCDVIWETLSGAHLKDVTPEGWLKVSRGFQGSLNFPNCIGAIDGRTVKISGQSQGGRRGSSTTVVLTAVSDADYCFACIDIGTGGGDGNSSYRFEETALGRKLYTDQLNLPQPCAVSENDARSVPYTFIVDEDFGPACANLIRPYPRKNLSPERRIFNYRLLRARRSVDCAFCILSNKWKVLQQPISVSKDFAETVIKACAILHNYVLRQDGHLQEDTLWCPLEGVLALGTGEGDNEDSSAVRDLLAKYFSSPEGAIPLLDNQV